MGGKLFIAAVGLIASYGVSAHGALMLNGGSYSTGGSADMPFNFVLTLPQTVPTLPDNTPNLGTPPQVLQPLADGSAPMILPLDGTGDGTGGGTGGSSGGAPVPEPATAALVGVGMAIAALRRRGV